MESIIQNEVFLTVALILLVSKIFSMLFGRIGLPQILGPIFAGIVIGFMNVGFMDIADDTKNILEIVGEIGVIFILFIAGMEVDFKEIKSTGAASFAVAAAASLVPIAGCFLLCFLFRGTIGTDPMTYLFFGIATATSISITISVLREMNLLHGKLGTILSSAAIIDSVIGLFLLALVLGGGNHGNAVIPIDGGIIEVAVSVVLFFAAAILIGYVLRLIFKQLAKKYDKRRRIFSLVLCFLFAYASDRFFGVSHIIGAFCAGVVISNISITKHVEDSVDNMNHLFFAPVFFAYIGIKYNLIGFDVGKLLFGLLFVVVAMLTKAIGCGAGARLFKMNNRQAAFIGTGMMSCGEVVVIIAAKGVNAGIAGVGDWFMPYAILLVIVTSVMTPIFMKLLNRKNDIEPALHNLMTDKPLMTLHTDK